MANFLIVGSGLMGRAMAYYLSKLITTNKVTICDIDKNNLGEARKLIKNTKVSFVSVDASKPKNVLPLMKKSSVTIGAVSYNFNLYLSKLAIKASCHFVDLGGNSEVVDRQFKLNKLAQKNSIAIIPDCGLAPGLAGILGANLVSKFDKCEELKIRVGGLPQNPRPPLNYMKVFSIEGLINEYKEPVRILANHKIKIVPGMSGLEDLYFPKPFGKLEAFYTSGGISTLIDTLKNKVTNMDYKTIRYCGHQYLIKFLMDMGLFDEKEIFVKNIKISPRKLTETIFEKKLSIKDYDLILVKVWAKGKIGRKNKTISYQLIDYYDRNNHLSSMMRTTGFPAAIIANMLAQNIIKQRGVLHQELVVPCDLLIKELAKEKIKLEFRD